MGIHWTCCQCEQQVEDHQYDSNEKMCEDCLNAEDTDLPSVSTKDTFWRDEVYVYLEKHFKLPKHEARKYLADWMNQYNQGEKQ